MSTVKTFAVNPGTNLFSLMQTSAMNLSSQGFDVDLQMFSPQSGMLNIKKDYDDIKKFLGLGYQSKVMFTVTNGTQLNVSIDSEWTYVLVMALIGWFLFWIPLIAAAIGAINLLGLPDKISNAVMNALAQNGAQQPYQPPRQPYQPPQQPYQPPQQPYQPPQQPYQPPQHPYQPPQQPYGQQPPSQQQYRNQ